MIFYGNNIWGNIMATLSPLNFWGALGSDKPQKTLRS